MQKNRNFSRIFASLLAAATVFSSSALALESVETLGNVAGPVDSAALADTTVQIVETFEGYEVGPMDTEAGIQLSENFGWVGLLVEPNSVEIAQDEATGNKYLKMTGDNLSFFASMDFEKTGEEYFAFDYLYNGSASAVVSSTEDATAEPAVDTLVASDTEWQHSYSKGLNVPFYGIIVAEGEETTLCLDNISYWRIPEGDTTEATVTFKNSTDSAPVRVVLPEKIKAPLSSQAEGAPTNTISLKDAVPSTTEAGYTFLGWSYADNGAVIAADALYNVVDTTLYAVWDDSNAVRLPVPFDGTFEDAKTDWSVVFPASDSFLVGNSTVEVVTDPLDANNKALKIVGLDKFAYVQAYVNLDPETDYMVSFDVWGDESNGGALSVTQSLRYAPSIETEKVVGGSVNGGNVEATAKVHKDLKFTAAQLAAGFETENKNTLRFNLQFNAAGTAYLDNLTITPILPEPVKFVNDFEEYEVGEKFEFIWGVTGAMPVLDENFELGTLGSNSYGEIKVDETGNKYLELTGKYCSFGFESRMSGTGTEHFTVDAKVIGSPGLQEYWGAEHTDHRSSFGTAEWKNYVFSVDAGFKCFGALLTSDGGSVCIDNVTYYGVPAKAANAKITTMFRNSTDAPDVTMPDAIESKFFETVDISTLVLTNTGTHNFLGWSETDGGEIITTTNWLAQENKTLYAVWEKVLTPQMTSFNSIRFGNNQGVRFASLITLPLANDESTEEYGFITTLKKFLDEKGLTESDLAFDADVKTKYGANYTKGEKAKIYDKTGEAIPGVMEGVNQAITAVITGVPASAYREPIVVRPYIKAGGATYYGTTHTQSYWRAAAEIRRDLGKYNALSAADKAQIDGVVSVSDNLIVNGDAEDPNTGIFECYEFYDEGQTPNATFSIVYDEEKQSNVWLIESPKRNNWTYTNYPFSFVPGEIYVITLDVKCVGSPESDEDVALQLYFNAQLRGEKDNARHLVNLKKSEGWKTISFSITAPEADNFAFFSNPVSGNGVSYMFDNITCQVLQ